ncbi:MAG: tetratricopeptide repeat protein [Sphingobacteriia bacterium]|jgi:tetratricopeptide (TPR) repeat protein
MKTWIYLIVLVLTISCNESSQQKNSDSNAAGQVDEFKSQQALLKKYPDSIELHLEFIDYLDSLKNYKAAILHINWLLQKDSLNQDLWFQKGQLAQKTKDTTTAKKCFRIANAIYPNAVYMLSLANLLAEQKDKEALIICANINIQFPGNDYKADKYFIQGIYFARTNNPAKANNYFDSCISMNYRYIEALMEKGFILYDKGQISAAIAIFDAVIQINPLYADGYYWKGKCFEKNKNIPAAIEQYQKAQSLDADLKEATNALILLQKK